MMRRHDEIRAQLETAGLLPFLVGDLDTSEPGIVRGQLRLQAILHLRRDTRFQEGIWHLLHKRVGKPRTEFRAIRGELGHGDNSLQVVINLRTGRFDADIDLYNTQDLVNVGGHLGVEVLWKRIAGWFRKKEAADDRA